MITLHTDYRANYVTMSLFLHLGTLSSEWGFLASLCVVDEIHAALVLSIVHSGLPEVQI